ncbi:unnamed protein product [Adineta steineri]|uniref:Uncharacterized protein n=1 Tax=Adineta steineri TaxID=433720 RepID=A0A819Q623_9BILA|nr:unnamed protein product [Adineta steineri]
MSNISSRTSPEELKVLTEIYNIFHPQELHFLIELNERWSQYDPNRIQNMTIILRETFASEHKEPDIERIITYFNSQDSIRIFSPVSVTTVLDLRDQTIHLNPYQSTCPICSSALTAEMADVLSVQVFTLKGKIDKGKVFSVSCKHNNTTFNMCPIVHVFPNYYQQDKVCSFTSQSLQSGNMVYLGGRQVFEHTLIENYTCQLLSKASSWQKFVDGLNLGAFNSNLTDTKIEWRKKLAMAFMKFKIIQFDLSLGSIIVSIPSSACQFDEWIWNEFPRLLTSFVYLWSNHKNLIGPCASNCSQCIVIDGHQKCRRRICRAKNVQVSTEEFNSLTVGCCRTPRIGSLFCDLHQHLQDTSDTSLTLSKKKKNKMRKSIPKLMRKKYQQHGFGATNCRTLKQKSQSYVERCNRSFGILAAVTNCKIVITYSEIFRSETLREIISLLCSTIRVLDNINTQAAEQLFSWVKTYANILSTLGWRRMPIYLLLIFHYKNLERVGIRPTRIFNIISSIPNVPTISLAYMADVKQVQQHEKTQRANFPEQFNLNSHTSKLNPSQAVQMTTIQGMVAHMEKQAQKQRTRMTRKHQRQQRKNQARRKSFKLQAKPDHQFHFNNS